MGVDQWTAIYRVVGQSKAPAKRQRIVDALLPWAYDFTLRVIGSHHDSRPILETAFRRLLRDDRPLNAEETLYSRLGFYLRESISEHLLDSDPVEQGHDPLSLVRTALARLSVNQRSLLIFESFMGVSRVDIGWLFGWSERRVERVIEGAKVRLTHLIEDEVGVGAARAILSRGFADMRREPSRRLPRISSDEFIPPKTQEPLPYLALSATCLTLVGLLFNLCRFAF